MAAAAYNNSFLLSSNTRNKTNTSITRRRYYSPSSSSCRSPSSFVSQPSSNSKKSITFTSTSSQSFRLRVLTPEEEGSQTQIQPETATAGGGGDFGGTTGGGGGGGGGRGDEEEDSSSDKKMSMSQKLTLGYAALVGVGGVMGYVKGGSQKSLAAGGLSSLLLYYVYTQLPVRPAFASSLGFGLSAALLVVMGSRFKKSGKLFPAGLVSFVSLVMTGGYLHGIMRGMH